MSQPSLADLGTGSDAVLLACLRSPLTFSSSLDEYWLAALSGHSSILLLLSLFSCHEAPKDQVLPSSGHPVLSKAGALPWLHAILPRLAALPVQLFTCCHASTCQELL